MNKIREAGAEVVTRLKSVVRPLVYVLALTLMPLAAWAQDEDEKMQIDPHTAAEQNRILAVIVILVLLCVLWYWWRRWQITRGSSLNTGGERKRQE